MRRCRECGCIDLLACIRVDLLADHAVRLDVAGEKSVYLLSFPSEGITTCSWVEDDLCSACAPDAPGTWQHPDREATDQLVLRLAGRAV